MDLDQIIRTVQPSAVVHRRQFPDGIDEDQAGDRATAVFVDRSTLLKDGIAEYLWRVSRDGPIVVLGATSAAESPDLPQMTVIDMPFFDTTIMDLLENISVRRTPGAA